MRLAAFVLCLISTILFGFSIIPLAWCIPMTMYVYEYYKGERDLSLAFMICTLIFVNPIAGILLLIESETSKNASPSSKKYDDPPSWPNEDDRSDR